MLTPLWASSTFSPGIFTLSSLSRLRVSAALSISLSDGMITYLSASSTTWAAVTTTSFSIVLLGVSFNCPRSISEPLCSTAIFWVS